MEGLHFRTVGEIVQFDFIDCRGISPPSVPGSFFKYKGSKQQY
jgi:hypothetical protein